jgi:hypothetical protein
MEAPGGWRDKDTGHAHWVPAGEEPVEPSPLAGVPLTAHVDPPRLHTLALPDGRFVLVVTGGGLPDGDYDTLRNLGKTVGAADVAVFVGHMEVR